MDLVLFAEGASTNQQVTTDLISEPEREAGQAFSCLACRCRPQRPGELSVGSLHALLPLITAYSSVGWGFASLRSTRRQTGHLLSKIG